MIRRNFLQRNRLLGFCFTLAAVSFSTFSSNDVRASIHSASGVSVTSGVMLAAEVNITVAGDFATFVLTNTSLNDVMIQSDILTAVFFDVTGNQGLSTVSAKVTSGSTIYFAEMYDPSGADVVGGEWAYESSLTGSPGGSQQGISSSGFGLFGQANFPGDNLQGPSAVNGLQYGITAAGDNMTTGQANQVTGKSALVKNSVTFVLSGATGLSDSDFSNVGFQYGTSTLDDTFLTSFSPGPPVPEPTTAAIWLGLGFATVLVTRRKS